MTSPALTRTVALLSAAAVFALPAGAFPPDTLAAALQQSTDRPNRRIPLLVIGAKDVRPDWSDPNIRLRELYTEQDAKPPLPDVVAGYGRQIMPCASVQVIAPLLRVGIGAPPGKPEEWARIGRERATRLLFASLSPAQWQTASSPQGIGLSDLQTPEQKAWFLSCLPPKLVVEQQEKTDANEYSSRRIGEPVVLAPETLRLRVVRTMSWNYQVGSGNGGGRIGFGQSDTAPHQLGERYWIRGYDTGDAVLDTQTYRDKISKTVLFTEPNRLMSGALPLNKPPLFGKSVLLADVKTVGELVTRIAQATGVELYCDRRISSLAVTVIGAETARADCADLVKALCFATTGTVRAVGEPGGDTVYLLTGNKTGTLAPRLALSEWASDVDALLNAEQIAFEGAAKKGGYVANIGFDKASSGAISDDVMKGVENRIRHPSPNRSYGDYAVPVSALPPAGQEVVRRDIAQHAQWQSGNGSGLDDKTVYARFSCKRKSSPTATACFGGQTCRRWTL